MADYVDWTGKSGRVYRYWFLANTDAQNIKGEGGNYAFVRQLPNGNYLPVYFGQAGDLRARIPTHEQLPAAIRLGAARAMAHTTPAGEQARLVEERDLIEAWNPPLNVQHRKVS